MRSGGVASWGLLGVGLALLGLAAAPTFGLAHPLPGAHLEGGQRAVHAAAGGASVALAGLLGTGAAVFACRALGTVLLVAGLLGFAAPDLAYLHGGPTDGTVRIFLAGAAFGAGWAEAQRERPVLVRRVL